MKKFLVIAISIVFIGLAVFLGIHLYNKYKPVAKPETSITVTYENTDNSKIRNHSNVALIGAGTHKFNVKHYSDTFNIDISFNDDVECNITLIDGESSVTMPAYLTGELTPFLDVELSYDYFTLTFKEGFNTTTFFEEVFSQYSPIVEGENLNKQFAFTVKLKSIEDKFVFNFFFSDNDVMIINPTEIVI